jgi:hypothetical protein
LNLAFVLSILQGLGLPINPGLITTVFHLFHRIVADHSVDGGTSKVAGSIQGEDAAQKLHFPRTRNIFDFIASPTSSERIGA